MEMDRPARASSRVDETLGEAHAALAYISVLHDYDWEAAERGFQRALALNPGYATARHWYALHLAYQGKLNQAQAEIERAREIDPLSLQISTDMVGVFYLRRAYDQAVEQARKTLDLDPTFPDAHLMLALAYKQKGMQAEALAEGEKAATFSTHSAVSLTCIGGCHAALGRKGEARKIIDELRELSRHQYVSSFFIAWIYANLRDKEASLAHLEQAYVERSSYLALVKVEPALDFLRSDPRFQDLQRRVGLPP